MNRLDAKQRAAIVAALVEGVGIRSTCRMTGASKGAVTKLIAGLGPVCAAYQDQAFHDLPCKTLEIDEILAFCATKQKDVPVQHRGKKGWGDTWTFTALCADTKLIPSWLVGDRDEQTVTLFLSDLANRLAGRAQVTTDGHTMYLGAVESAFGGDADYAMLVKSYGVYPEAEKRYSPADCTGGKKARIQGEPDMSRVSTSYVERTNLGIRLGLSRFTRLANAHSKKLQDRCAALAIYFMYYNFARTHSTIRCSPAMAAGVTPHLWSVEEIVGLLPTEAPKKRGPYKKRISN
ncbi:MAG TPA: IS1 family transposase [Thermoanaerobaculia bacterium]